MLLTCGVVIVCLRISVEACTCLVAGKLGVRKFINYDDFIKKIFLLYVLRYAVIVFLIKCENENWHHNHDRGGLVYLKRIENCKNRRLNE